MLHLHDLVVGEGSKLNKDGQTKLLGAGIVTPITTENEVSKRHSLISDTEASNISQYSNEDWTVLALLSDSESTSMLLQPTSSMCILPSLIVAVRTP